MNVSDRASRFDTCALALDVSPVPMFLVDQTGKSALTNKRLEQLIGYEAEELHGRAADFFIHLEDGDTSSDERQDTQRVLNKLVNSSDNFLARHRDGREIPIQIAEASVEAPKGPLTIVTVTDQSAQVRALQRAEQRQKELEALNADLSRFAYGASHDLKAPISSIIGLLNFCIEDLEDGALEDLKQNLTQASDLCYDSAARIDAVFEVARVGQEIAPVSDFRVETVVREAWDSITRAFDRPAELLLELKHQDPIRFERPTFVLIVENLISNAIRFHDPDKASLTVRVQTWVAADRLHISIRDNGVGIPKDRLQDIFKMFRHIDKRSGNGLGLALSKRHVERLGGKIVFNSTENEGSEFRVELPYEKGKAE